LASDNHRASVWTVDEYGKHQNAVRFCEHFLGVAKQFKTVKWGSSEEFAEFYRCEEQMCCENCQRIANKIPALHYFEGYVAVGEVIDAHAWLVDETGEVIDPTLVLHPTLKEQVGGYMGLNIPTLPVLPYFN